MKFMVGPVPMLGLRGHSAALTNPLRSSFFRFHVWVSVLNSGSGVEGEKVAYICTCVSIVKLLIDVRD